MRRGESEDWVKLLMRRGESEDWVKLLMRRGESEDLVCTSTVTILKRNEN
jgi:hypothetical protein